MHRQADPEYIRDYYACDAQVTDPGPQGECLRLLERAGYDVDSLLENAKAVEELTRGRLTERACPHLAALLRGLPALGLAINSAHSCAARI